MYCVQALTVCAAAQFYAVPYGLRKAVLPKQESKLMDLLRLL